jgi:hypothetical protein
MSENTSGYTDHERLWFMVWVNPLAGVIFGAALAALTLVTVFGMRLPDADGVQTPGTYVGTYASAYVRGMRDGLCHANTEDSSLVDCTYVDGTWYPETYTK